jgi:hypothetical protein
LSEIPGKLYRRFDSVREYEDLTDALIGVTQRTLRVFDRSLSRRYNTPGRAALLSAFLHGGRANELLVVVHDASGIARDCARLVQLHQTFGSAIKIRQTLKNVRHVYDPCVISDASHYLHRFHYDHMRAALGMNDPDEAGILLDRFGQLWEASVPVAVGGSTGL